MKDRNLFRIYGRTFQVSREATVWCVQELDAQGNQIGDAVFAPSRDLALIYIGTMAMRRPWPSTL